SVAVELAYSQAGDGIRGKLVTGVQTCALPIYGRRLASASEDATVKLWDASAPQDSLVLRGQDKIVNSVALSGNGRWAASGSSDRSEERRVGSGRIGAAVRRKLIKDTGMQIVMY